MTYIRVILFNEWKREKEMKILLSKGSIAETALLMLLSLSAVASMTALVNATAAIKNPTVYINGSGSVKLTWKSGKSQIYSSDAYANLGGLDTVTIIPTHGWHINDTYIDGNSQEILDEDGFSLINVKAKNMISVTFVENNGIDDVDLGSNVEAYPDPAVGLIFYNVLAEGFVTAYTIGLEPPDAISESWDIQTDAIFDQSVKVLLVLTFDDLGGVDPTGLKMWRTEVELARSDVNLDGIVDGDDVSDVANANPSEPGDPKWEPRLDLNDDLVIDYLDVNIVNNYIGELVWEDITFEVVVDYDLELVYVYGVTDHLSIFHVH